jgi:hypothetical protein
MPCSTNVLVNSGIILSKEENLLFLCLAIWISIFLYAHKKPLVLQSFKVISPEKFEEIGLELVVADEQKRKKKSEDKRLRIFKGHFGLSPVHTAMLWILLGENNWFISKSEPNPQHLLWALLLLKQYSTEIVLAGKAGVDEKTFRKWAWHYIEGISKLSKKLVREIMYTRTWKKEVLCMSSNGSLYYMISCMCADTIGEPIHWRQAHEVPHDSRWY